MTQMLASRDDEEVSMRITKLSEALLFVYSYFFFLTKALRTIAPNKCSAMGNRGGRAVLDWLIPAGAGFLPFIPDAIDFRATRWRSSSWDGVCRAESLDVLC